MIYDAALDESKPPYEQQGLPSEEVTIAEILKERGMQPSILGSGIWVDRMAWPRTSRVSIKAC